MVRLVYGTGGSVPLSVLGVIIYHVRCSQQMKKYLKGLDLNPVKIKKLPQQTFCFVTFSCEEDKQVCTCVLSLTFE